MTVPTPDEAGQSALIVDQAAIDQADAAVGYRTVLDVEDAAELPASDPNRAVDHADELDHLAYIGDPVEDDDVAAVNRALAAQGGTG